MYEIKIVDYNPNDPHDDRSILQVWHNGELIRGYTDYGEPEDNSFKRDYDWIQHELLAAYKLGRFDAAEEKQKEV